ncbi:MAG: triple tyrosine motif-containing protein, partial [Bacteroidales bacterium]
GYLSEGDKGKLSYHSLSEKLPGDEKNFGEIWRIYSTRYGIVFQSFLKIFLLADGELRSFSAGSRFGFSYFVDNNLFVVDRSEGIFLLKGRNLQLYYRNRSFFRDNDITFLIQRGVEDYLLGTTNNGIFVLKDKKLVPWQAELNSRFIKDQIYTGIRLENDQLAIGTIQNGVYVINMQGKIIQHVNRYKGLQNNTVLSLFSDRSGNLWLGLDNGIDMLEVSSPITVLNYCYNIETSYASIVHNKILYIGTNQGLFAKKLSDIGNQNMINSGFKLVEGTMGQVWKLEIIDDALFCGHNFGTFIINGFRAYKISEEEGGWDYAIVPGNEDYLIGGTYNGLMLYKKNRQSMAGWENLGYLKGVSESCKDMLFDQEGNLWVTHGYKGIFRFTLSGDLRTVEESHLYNTRHGLPELPYSLTEIHDKFLVVSNDGFFEYDSANDTFLTNEKYNSLFAKTTGITKIIEDYYGDIWYFGQAGMGVYRLQEDGTYTDIDIPFHRIRNQFISGSFENIYVYDKNNVFIGSQKGMIHYDPSKQKDFKRPYNAFIGEVKIHGKHSDSTLFYRVTENPDEAEAGQETILPYKYNSMSFSFFTPYFEAPNDIQYSYRLSEFEENWSDWSDRSIKEYTNLPAGEYVFEVRAKNIYRNESHPARFRFIITPPFYRSKLAYILYMLLFLVIAFVNLLFLRHKIEKTRHYEKQKHSIELDKKEKKYREEAELSEQEIDRLKNEQLVIEMRHKNMEMANSTMHLIQKNKFLRFLKNELLGISGSAKSDYMESEIKKIVKKIDSDLRNERHWQVFDKYFDEVHQDFIQRLKEKHPELTPKELRLCAYLKMNISTKEIAPLMNISIRGVEVSRYRLRKKLGIGRDVNLIEYILGI